MPPPDYSASDVQALFDRIAPVYDQLNNDLSLGIHWVWKQMAVSWSGANAGNCCLDLCCGSGDIAQLLAKRVGETGQVYGADFAAAQLATAKTRVAQLYLPPVIEWVQADALNLPFADDFFDAATLGYGLRNVTDIPRCLTELHRVLKPEAQVAILDFHRPDNWLAAQFQRWYLDHMVVPTARRYDLTDEYAYLMPSVAQFPIGTDQVKLGLVAGFAAATHYPIAGGIMGILVLRK
jgi:demethylmenaquinone methyltransferase/2-methoxy-6-polyprenyl-1,4-benzoquinol methylase